jgi:hypothetical protein
VQMFLHIFSYKSCLRGKARGCKNLHIFLKQEK